MHDVIARYEGRMIICEFNEKVDEIRQRLTTEAQKAQEEFDELKTMENSPEFDLFQMVLQSKINGLEYKVTTLNAISTYLVNLYESMM